MDDLDLFYDNFCACTARFVSDLFGNHIVGFLVTQLISVYDNMIVGPTAEDVECRARAPVDSDITEKLRRLVDSKVRGIGNYPVVGMYTGVRPATQYKDYVLKCQPNRWVTD